MELSQSKYELVERSSSCFGCGKEHTYKVEKNFYNKGTSQWEVDAGQNKAYCDSCSESLRSRDSKTMGPFIQLDSDGGIYDGYNHGLGLKTNNRGEYKAAVAEARAKGIVPAEEAKVGKKQRTELTIEDLRKAGYRG